MPVIEVFADVSCPFTHVGLRRVVEERARRGRDDIVLRVRAWPLQVVNGEALDGPHVADRVAALRSQVAPDLFTGFDPRSFPTSTLPALALTAAAGAADPRTGEAVALALRDLLFEQGVDVADREVLRRIAAEHGVDADLDDTTTAMADHAEGVRRGVVGSPHFFTAGGDVFCPVLDISRDDEGGLHIEVDRRGLDDLLTACFD